MESSRRRPPALVAIALLAVVAVAAGTWVVLSRAANGPLVGAPDAEAPTTTLPAPEPLAQPIQPTGDAAFDAGVSEVARFVEQARGHPFKDPVQVRLLDDTAFNQALLADFASTTNELRKTEVALKALGLLPTTADLVTEVRKSLAAGVIGLYDPKSKQLLVRGSDLTPFTRTTLAHELTHALDDQWFGLDRPELDQADDEAQFGFQALTEGSASWVEDAWRKSRSAAEQAQAEGEGRAFAAENDLSDLSPTVVQIIESPYSLGLEFVNARVAAGGVDALDQAFLHPPRSSEQVLHPQRYVAGDQPVTVDPPPSDDAKVDDGVLGELGLVQVLSVSLAPAQARQAGEGWAGDHYVVWRTPTGSSCLRVDVLTDTPTDDQELLDAARAWRNHQSQATVTEPRAGVVRVTSCH